MFCWVDGIHPQYSTGEREREGRTKMWFWRKRRDRPENQKYELMVTMADGPNHEYPMVMADGDIRQIAALMGQTLGLLGKSAAKDEGYDKKVAYDLLLAIVKENMENDKGAEYMTRCSGEQWLFYNGLRR